MLALQNNAPANFELPGSRVTPSSIVTASAKFDLAFAPRPSSAPPTARPPASTASFEYATDLFDRGTVEALAQRLIRLLEAAVANPEQPIGSLDILSAAERHTILREWNDTARPIPSATLPELFAAQAARTPDARGGGVRGCDADLRAARRPRQSAGASSAKPRRRSRGGGGAVRRALAGDDGRAARHPQSRRRLSAARSSLSAGASRLHAGRRRRAGAAHPIGAARHGCPRTRAKTVCLDADWPAIAQQSHRRRRPIACVPPTPPTSSTPRARPARPKASLVDHSRTSCACLGARERSFRSMRH